MSKKKQTNEHIQVFVRCRPLQMLELYLPVPVEVHPEVNKILVRDTGADKSTVKSFSFDKVFGPEAKQADIYAEVVAPIIQEVIMGFNCTIFAYGQTGTGKTFTIEGGRTANLKDISEDPLTGIIPRSMKHLFNELTDQNMKFEICVSFLELYNEEIFDLLSKIDDHVKLKMFNSAQKGSVIVQGLEVRPVTSMKEVYSILDIGFKKRRKAATLLNKTSSRSHTVFTVTVNLKESSTTFEKMKSGKLNLVDLAGSENIGRSGAVDKRAREAGNINQSLLALGRVITSLCEKAGHIPYRESKLTRLLQDSLGGQTKTAVIATISPSTVHVDETLNTLEYALRAKNITNKPELNTQVTVTSLTKDYLEEISRLKNGIYEWAAKNGFYVPEECLRHWKSTLASKRTENCKTFSQIENLMEEEKSLDAAIQEANNYLNERKNHLEDAKLRCEGHRQELEKGKENHKLHEAMLQVMQPLYDHLHDKLHTAIEEKRRVESEAMKVKVKLKTSIEELRNLRKKFQNVQESWNQRHEQIHLDAENLLSNIKNMNDNVNSLSSECNSYVSVIENDFETAKTLWENEFKNLFKSVSDLEAINKSFQENMELTLSEEKSTKLKWIEEFYESYLASNDLSVLEPLHTTLNDCENCLLGISSALNDWKNRISSEMTVRQNVMEEHLKNQNTTLESMTDCTNKLLSKQKENLEAYNKIIVECCSSETNSKLLWTDRFLCVERALSSLDIFCTDYIKSEIDKTTQTNTLLMNSSRLGSEITKTLSTYCVNSVKNIDSVQEEIDLHELKAFSGEWEQMKKKVDSSCAKYKDLNTELARFSSIAKDVDVLPSHNEDVLNKFNTFEQPTISTYSQEMVNPILKCGDSYKTYLMENQAQINELLLKNKTHVEKLTESSKFLSNSVSNRVPECVQRIETDLQKFLTTKENIEVNDSKTETIDVDETLFDGDITITSSECLEEANPGSECQICANKISDEALNIDENEFSVTATVQCLKNPLASTLKVTKVEPETSGAKSFMSHFPRSPVRRPRSRNIPPVRRNLQFLDFEKLTYELLQCSSDEEV